MERIVIEYIKGLVSIIIPTHNREELICETLDSVIKQTYKSIEVIVVDDHSEDGTKDIVLEYIHSHPENKIYMFDNDGKGACAARNKGLRESKGEYLQFFDDDDLMFENHLERKVSAIEESGYDYVACDFSYFDSETGLCCGNKIISTIEHNCASHLLMKSFPCPCFMCKRKAINAMGFWDESINKLQDMVYFQRLFLLEMKGVYLQEELFNVRIHKGSMTSLCVLSPDGYYAQYYAYSVINKEWRNSRKSDKDRVSRSLLFLKYTICRNMYKKGFRVQGTLLMLRTLVENLFLSISFCVEFLKYRTIHITDILVNENKTLRNNK